MKLKSGLRVDTNVVGINLDGEPEVYAGFDGGVEIDDPAPNNHGAVGGREPTREEYLEIADAMIERWMMFKARLNR